MQLGKNDRKRKLLDMSKEEGRKKNKTSSNTSSSRKSTPAPGPVRDTKRITKGKPNITIKTKGKMKA